MSTGARIAFAGGGSGGHIHPAIVIAMALRTEDPGSACLFLASERAIDAKILDGGMPYGGEPIDWRPLPARPMRVSPRGSLAFLNGYRKAVTVAMRALQGHRAQVLIVTGGFVSPPAATAAHRLGIPVVLVNMDAVAGKASRLIARNASLRLTALAGPDTPSDWHRITPIVAPEPSGSVGADRTQSRAAVLAERGLDPSLKTLLVTGGSQGARSINALIERLLTDRPDAFAGWQLLWQTGPTAGSEGGDGPAAVASRVGVGCVACEYFAGMGELWRASDLAVSRAGAGGVADAWVAQVPTVFLPYPGHRDNHQRWNAMPLADAGAAVICEDAMDVTVNLGKAGQAILELLRDDPRRGDMRKSLEKLGRPHGAETAAALVLDLISA